MIQPNVKNTAYDKGHNVTYHVMAYRKLSPNELMANVSIYRSGLSKRKRAERNRVITIYTVIGMGLQ
jgi:hypothetical protein